MTLKEKLDRIMDDKPSTWLEEAKKAIANKEQRRIARQLALNAFSKACGESSQSRTDKA